jgi:hypothetical protein
VLDLTLRRMRQIRDVILERQDEDRRASLSVRENELRTTAQFIAATTGSKRLMAEAGRVRLLTPLRDPQTGTVLRANSRNGSYEVMVGMFGQMEQGRG